MDWDRLVEAALRAREAAYAPYSRFRVGAAVASDDGTVHSGCNVENRSFGLTVCAERVALACAVVSGHRRFTALVVVSDASPPAPPCGLCLQALSEFAEALPILLVNLEGERHPTTLRDLHPSPFALPGPASPGEGA